MIPVINHTVTDGIMDSITGGLRIGEGFVSNEEVKVFYTAFRCEISRFRRYGRTATSRLSGGPTGSNCGRENTEGNRNVSVARDLVWECETYYDGSELPAKLRSTMSECIRTDHMVLTLSSKIQFHCRR